MNEARDIHNCETDSTVVTDNPLRGSFISPQLARGGGDERPWE